MRNMQRKAIKTYNLHAVAIQGKSLTKLRVIEEAVGELIMI
ncbi:unnamed protein product [Moneuplotes crassus]|uniref:Uncharacterized protein n=1 Tax=Euplotes crassus TaxID=5936 RepID=A0AAD1UNS7_EUPCR|nr:unnamed protein product [Moneuplotes crassus]